MKNIYFDHLEWKSNYGPTKTWNG